MKSHSAVRLMRVAQADSGSLLVAAGTCRKAAALDPMQGMHACVLCTHSMHSAWLWRQHDPCQENWACWATHQNAAARRLREGV